MYHDWHLQVHDGGPVRECRDSPATRHLKMVNADQLVLASDQLVPLWKPPVVEKAGGWKGFLQVVKPGEHDTLPVKREIHKSHSGKRFWPKVETYNQHNVSWCTTERVLASASCNLPAHPWNWQVSWHSSPVRTPKNTSITLSLKIQTSPSLKTIKEIDAPTCLARSGRLCGHSWHQAAADPLHQLHLQPADAWQLPPFRIFNYPVSKLSFLTRSNVRPVSSDL